MTTHPIDGRALARRIRDEAARLVRDEKLDPGLGVVLVGDDTASRLYVGLKERACAETGIRFEKRVFPADATQETVLGAIEAFNRDDAIHAILVQLPLPEHLDEDAIIDAIEPRKDVDGFQEKSPVAPGLATGIVLLAKEPGAPLKGKSLHVMANSDIFRKNIEAAFLKEGAVAIDDLAMADIIVVAVGRPHALTKGMIKSGAIVIDVGTNRIGAKLVGDADDLNGVAGAVTPVPGGVGPVTVAMLIRNTVALAERARG